MQARYFTEHHYHSRPMTNLCTDATKMYADLCQHYRSVPSVNEDIGVDLDVNQHAVGPHVLGYDVKSL